MKYPTLIELPDVIRGQRITLRPYRPDDAPAVFAAIEESRDDLRPWMLWVDNHISVDDTRDFCARSAASWLLRTILALGIFDARDERFLGGTGLTDSNWPLRSFEIGYWIRTSAVGNGFATEAVNLLVDFAFTDLQARRVALTCDPRNQRSRQVAERTGFVYEGHLRNAALTSTGEPRDTLVFSLIPADWQRLRAGNAS